MKIGFVLGTSGELIKLYPVMKTAEDRKLSWKAFSTGQSGLNFKRQWDQFQLDPGKLHWMIPRETDLRSSFEALRWFGSAIGLQAKKLSDLVGCDILVVHGDTLSTLVGAAWSWRVGKTLAHVEAGLRSNHLWNPFPEEINRRWVSRFADFHFAPDAWAQSNLIRSKVRGQVIQTGGNTMGEALALMLQQTAPSDLPRSPFVLANIHRFENLNSPTSWRLVQETLFKAAEAYPVYLVLHPPTRSKIESEGLVDKFQSKGVHLVDRKPFHEFAHWLAACEYLVSDGGSNQEECSYLGKPCLILRTTTERKEGLDGSCMLSGLDERKIDHFLKHHASYRRPALGLDFHPSEMILDSLQSCLS